VRAVGIEIASLIYKSVKVNGVAPPPKSNWSQLEHVPNPKRLLSSRPLNGRGILTTA
jgi:hypothetical protein